MAHSSSSKYWKIPKVAYMRVRKGKKRAEIEVLTQKGILRNGRRLRGRPKMKKLMKKDEKKVKYLLEKYY